MDLSWNSLEAKHMEGRKMGGRRGKKEREGEVAMGRGNGDVSTGFFMNVQALAQKWLLSVGGK